MGKKKSTGSGQTQWKRYRSSHRAKSHRQIHAIAIKSPLVPVLEHKMVPKSAPNLITEQPDLHTLVGALQSAGRFAYDAEFIGENSYEPQFCLLQVATTQDLVLIDTLAGLDLTPFWTLLIDERIEKVVHAGRQDFEPAARQLNQPPRHVFDTQIAAAFAGFDYPAALPTLVKSIIGAELGHGTKFSNWNERPLSDAQRYYAANDVRYLLLLHAMLADKLDGLGNTMWANCAYEELSDIRLYQFDASTQRDRTRGAGTLSSRKRAVLLSLIHWRDGEARHRNIPARTLLKDEYLVDLARRPPATIQQFQKRQGIPQVIKQDCGQAVVEAIHFAMTQPIPPSAGGSLGPITKETRDIVDQLLKIVRQRCAERQIHPAVITSRKKLTRLARAAMSGQPIDGYPLVSGWRQDLLGEDLLEPLGWRKERRPR